MKISKVGKVFHVTHANPMFGIMRREIPIVFYTKKELHEMKTPSWSKMNLPFNNERK